MDSVPDDVLLAVLRLLPARCLLAARLVCRRWGELATHADVWRGRCFPLWGASQRAALRLAPCAASLHFHALDRPQWPVRAGELTAFLARMGSVVSSPDPHRQHAAFAETDCAAASLSVSITTTSSSDTDAAARAIRKQVRRCCETVSYLRLQG